MKASACLMDGKKVTDMKVPFLLKHIEKKAIQKSQGTIIYELMKQYGLI